jgi:ATP-dependent protease ClpP protease subunit
MKYNMYIRGMIGGWWGVSSDQVIYQLNNLQGKKVDVAICSPGGAVDTALEIYQAFKDHGDVHAHIIGMTASAATIIAMGCKTVDIVKNSLVLIHNAMTSVSEWQSANKEQLDNLIAKFKKQREDLNTVDDVIASIYADKCKKPIDECKKKMKDAKWLTAQNCLDLGIVDSIREDSDDDKAVNDIRDSIDNPIYNSLGLPAFPAAAEQVADDEGNPTESFLQKCLNTLGDRFHINNNKNNKSMKHVFTCLCTLLAVDCLEGTETNVTLSVDDLKKIEDNTKKLNDDIKALTTAKDTAVAAAKDEIQKQLDAVKAQLTEKEAEINNLKGAPGEKTDETPAVEESGKAVDYEQNRKMYNLYC